MESKPLSKNFGERIKRIREEEEITQQELADRLGVNRSTVNRLEKGATRITLERLSRVLDALGYEASLSIEKSATETRTEWGIIETKNPVLRHYIRSVRKIAEEIASLLYEKYDVDEVYIFGSLAEHGAPNFNEKSDLDIMVKGIDPKVRFDAKNEAEELANEPLDDDNFLEVDIVREEDFPVKIEKLATHFIPGSVNDE